MKSALLLRLLLVAVIAVALAAPAAAADGEFDKVAAAADAWANSGKQMVITADKLFELINDGDKANDPVIVDIRAAADYNRGFIPGAINIPFASLFKAENIAKLPKDKTIVLYCYTGHTCSMSAFALGTMGYNALTLKWGIMGWTKDNTVRTLVFGQGSEVSRDYKVETTAASLTGTATPPTMKTGKATVAEMLAAAADAFLASGKPTTIAADKVFENLNDGDKTNDPLIIDLRAPADYAKGHIPAAVNITLANLFKPATLAQLPTNKQIVFVCYTGHNSSMASLTAAAMGYNAISLKYGIMGWTKDTNVAPMRFGVGADAEKDFKVEKTAAAAATTAPAATTAAAPVVLPKAGAVPTLPVAALVVSGLMAMAAGLRLRRR
jgi:rhodanese-related sulfurtransferase